MLENYLEFLEEYRKLLKEFAPIHEQLRREAFILHDRWLSMDHERCEKEYFQPLSEKSKNVMEKIIGTNDYLFLWENNIPQNICAYIEEQFKGEDYFEARDLHDLFMLNYTLDVFYEHRAEILKDTSYDGIKTEARNLNKLRGRGINNPLFSVAGSGDLSINTMFDTSWYIMAIYSFKNDRASDILFDMCADFHAVSGFFVDYDVLGDWAVYYLSLFPNSAELLPKVRSLLKGAIAEEQKNHPDRAQLFLNENDEVINPWETLRFFRTSPTVVFPPTLLRLARLVRALEFNEKIPADKRERFDTFRREIAITWSLAKKSPRTTIRVPVTLPKGYEHFERFFQEYRVPGILYEFRKEAD